MPTLRKSFETTAVAKKKHSALGKRLIASAKEMVAHTKGEMKLDIYEVKIPPQVDVIVIRKRLGLSQAGFVRRFGFSPRAVQDWEHGRRKLESAARAYLLVIAREPKAVRSEGGGAGEGFGGDLRSPSVDFCFSQSVSSPPGKADPPLI